MVYHVEIMPRATRDLINIYYRIHAADSPRALAWFNRLENMMYSLEKQPHRGAITPESNKLRHLLYGTKPDIYRIIYAIDEYTQKINILHIRHGARAAFVPNEL